MQWSDIPFRSADARRSGSSPGCGWPSSAGLAALAGPRARPSPAGGSCAGAGADGRPGGPDPARLLRPIYVGWMVLAFPIGWTVSQVILAVMFFGLFTPIGLVFRLIGRDPLHRARRPGVESYWTPKPTPADLRTLLQAVLTVSLTSLGRVFTYRNE